MTTIADSPLFSMQGWLKFTVCGESDLYRLHFSDEHIGNPLIRSVHGGVSATLIEMSAQTTLQNHLGPKREINLISSSVDFLRITKDIDVHARAKIVRVSRRMAFIDVWCWQDDENMPIARGTCTLRIYPQ